MDAFVGWQSALEHWHSRYRAEPYSAQVTLCDTAATLKEIALLENPNCPRELFAYRRAFDDFFTMTGMYTRPIHLLTDDRSKRQPSERFKVHAVSAPLPDNAFVEVKPGLYVASPELCYVQAVSYLHRIELIELGYELCGSYALLGPRRTAAYDLKPLTSVEKIGAFLESAPTLNGVQGARRALKYVRDGSASPKETELTMSLCLPYSLQGSGLEFPILNYELPVPRRLQHLTFRHSFRCDLYWPEYMLDVEYDGEDHAEIKQRALDANRSAVLAEMGVNVVVVTREQLDNPAEFEQVLDTVRARMGLRRDRADWDTRRRRSRLRRFLSLPYEFRDTDLLA